MMKALAGSQPPCHTEIKGPSLKAGVTSFDISLLTATAISNNRRAAGNMAYQHTINAAHTVHMGD